MKEKILITFKNLGFEMEYLEDLGYGFEYEGIHYLWMASDDETFLNIAIPAVFKKADSTEQEFYMAMDKLNSTLKYVKAYELGNSMWLFYERELLGEENFEDLLPRIILRLEHALHTLRDEEQDNDDCQNDETEFLIEDVDLLTDNNKTDD